MMGHLLKALMLNEVRLRLRRTASMVAVLAVVALSWAMISDPAGGNSLIVIDKARVLYTSSALALGSAALAALLFGLGGFYLVRGRMSEDIRSGAGAVIGATPVSGALFLFGRWVGAVAYLGALIFAFALTILLLHALRGDGAIEPLVYLQTYFLLMLPMVCFVCSCALLFDSWAPLMGKRGDLLFFVLWTAQMVLIVPIEQAGAVSPLMLLDFSGLGMAVVAIKGVVATNNFGIGSAPFDAALAPITLPVWMWSGQMAAMRAASVLVALLPLLPAAWLFHRFSPDRVKLARSRERRTPLALLNGGLRPLSGAMQPVLRWSAAWPGMAGQVLADLALTFLMAPAALVALIASVVAALVVDAARLPVVLMAAVACWGVLVSDLATRDFNAGIEDMSGSVAGGVARRYLRQFAAAWVLGLLLTGVVALRWAMPQPQLALALLAGLFCLAALASLFGRCSRSSRLFLALFLFAFYVAANVRKVPLIDAVGFNGAANLHSAAIYAAIGAVALAVGYWWNRRAMGH